MRCGPVRLLFGLSIVALAWSTAVMAARLAGAPSAPARPPATDVLSSGPTPSVQTPRSEQSARSLASRLRSDDPSEYGNAEEEGSDRLSSSGLPVRLVVKPSCVSYGDRLTAVVKTAARAHLSLAVAYSDGQSHGTWHIGATDERGKLRFTWLVPPQASEGPGVVLVAASDDERSGTASKEFRIVGSGAC